jgi:sucrose-6-phosphate hydrolase SacC (GH32 family)
VVWHEPSKRWILALYLDKEEYALFSSPDMKAWTQLQTLTLSGSSECPDFFELPVSGPNGPTAETRWVFTGANGHYLVGGFDGKRFTPDAGPQVADHGGNTYAVQTYSDMPGRRVQITWMTGGSYPGMPFNQQMSFPCQLTLRPTPEGLRLTRWPVAEIASLYLPGLTQRDLVLKPGENPLSSRHGDLWDVEAEFEFGAASAVGLQVRGQTIRYSVKDGAVTCLGHTGPLKPEGGRVRLRLLVDRASIELFGNGGALSMTSCFLPPKEDLTLGVFAEGGDARLVSLRATPLKSAWPARPARPAPPHRPM